MRLPWKKHHEPPVDPNRPHTFRPKSDGGAAVLMPMSGGAGRQIANIAGPSAYARTLGCGVPGCGQPRDALIHAPEE